MKNITIFLSSEEQKQIKKPVSQTNTNHESPQEQLNVKTEKNEDDEPVTTKELMEILVGMKDQNKMLVELLQKSGLVNSSGNNEAINFKDFTKQITRAISDSKEDSTGRLFGFRSMDPSEIDPEDVLEVPVLFFSFSSKYAVYDDFRNGHPINAPHGAVKFKSLTRTVEGGGGRNAPKYNNTSIAVVFSKEQVKWLKGHSLFGITFFENLGQSKNVKQEEAEQIAKAYNMISGLTGHQLRSRCLQEKIEITTMDEHELRGALIKKITERLTEEANQIKTHNLRSSLQVEVPKLGTY